MASMDMESERDWIWAMPGKVIGNGNANHDDADMLMMEPMMLTMAIGECHSQWVSMQMLTKLVSKRIDYMVHTHTHTHTHGQAMLMALQFAYVCQMPALPRSALREILLIGDLPNHRCECIYFT